MCAEMREPICDRKHFNSLVYFVKKEEKEKKKTFGT